MIQVIRRAFFKSFFFFSGILILSACSENFEDFPNLSECGERPIFPSSANVQKEIGSLEKDRTFILKNAS
ncbi:MAG: hypothetical protein B7Y25_05505 [Alphaproteobacteria bacterium 16-39-46]|nr:MAG: hypothetical protein B7Y25_05505 [Alphaproteobacteria bacterium 16-39-46]OZA44271.1 MAG: hypothetical protein B7X84_00835 [Alphaproteobacteria bacterium 17-39-52]